MPPGKDGSFMILFDHASLITPQGVIGDGWLLVDGACIAALGTPATHPHGFAGRLVDATGLLLAPGLIDVQINGLMGSDYTVDPSSIWSSATHLPRYGVTTYLPTIITSPPQVIQSALKVLQAGPPPGWIGADPLGLHIEGPFLSLQKKGAHNPRFLRSLTLDEVSGWSPASGVRLLTLAPELDGAVPVIQKLSRQGVVVSLGHSNATYAQAIAAFDQGATCGTHLFCAMSGLEHRAPGLAAALLTDPRPWFGLIADGVHVHPPIVALAWKAASSRFVLVTDAMTALGMPPGIYTLGDYQIQVDDKAARLTDDTLAGSILSLDQAVRNLCTFTGCTFVEAIQAATHHPADLLGLTDRGRLAEGLKADLAFFDTYGNVIATFIDGECVYTPTKFYARFTP
jgi:N-acetylglucosamine-6-phosphate deacetylase